MNVIVTVWLKDDHIVVVGIMFFLVKMKNYGVISNSIFAAETRSNDS